MKLSWETSNPETWTESNFVQWLESRMPHLMSLYENLRDAQCDTLSGQFAKLEYMTTITMASHMLTQMKK